MTVTPFPANVTSPANIKPRRSALYMPGSNARALDKARDIAADVLILDLEDAVAPDMKAVARRQVTDAVRAGGYDRRELVIRINGIDTPWFADDLAATVAARPHAILLPKVSKPETLREVGLRMAALDAAPGIALWAMIETPLAILHAEAIASAARDSGSRLACLVMGTNDLSKETRARLLPGRAPMLPWLMSALAAARAHGIDIIDGVWNALADEAGFAAECAQGRDMGFDGKTLIHPAQVAVANATFAPTPDEIMQAQSIIYAFSLAENADKGAIQLNGRMVELLHAEMARRVMALAQAIAG